jgi:hypothetical protein
VRRRLLSSKIRLENMKRQPQSSLSADVYSLKIWKHQQEKMSSSKRVEKLTQMSRSLRKVLPLSRSIYLPVPRELVK